MAAQRSLGLHRASAVLCIQLKGFQLRGWVDSPLLYSFPNSARIFSPGDIIMLVRQAKKIAIPVEGVEWMEGSMVPHFPAKS